jgi:hypothetical protein
MTLSWRSYIIALSAKFNECIARHKKVPRRQWVEEASEDSSPTLEVSYRGAHLPAADSEKESQDVGLLLLVKLFDVFEGTHLW